MDFGRTGPTKHSFSKSQLFYELSLIIDKGLHSKVKARNRSKIEIKGDIFHWCCMSFRSLILICTHRFRVSGTHYEQGSTDCHPVRDFWFDFLIMALRISAEIQCNVIRFSTGKHTSSEDIVKVGEFLKSIVAGNIWPWILFIFRLDHPWFDSWFKLT